MNCLPHSSRGIEYSSVAEVVRFLAGVSFSTHLVVIYVWLRQRHLRTLRRPHWSVQFTDHWIVRTLSVIRTSWSIPIEIHGVGRASLRPRPEVGRVPQHLRQWHSGVDDLHPAALLLRLNLTAPASEI